MNSIVAIIALLTLLVFLSASYTLAENVVRLEATPPPDKHTAYLTIDNNDKDLIPIVTGGQGSVRATCTGEWQGTGGDIRNNWFAGEEMWASYQDPIETGCMQTYPFGIEMFRWDLYSYADTTVTLGPLRLAIWDVDRTTPGCPQPGDVIGLSSDLYLELPPTSTYLLTVSLSETFCVSGPYFGGFWVPETYPIEIIGLWRDNPSPNPPRTCASYKHTSTGWHDLITWGGWPHDLRLWTEGEPLASGGCSCSPGVSEVSPGWFALNIPMETDSVSALYFGSVDIATVDSSHFLVYGSQSGYYEGEISHAGPLHAKFDIDGARDFLPGEVVTATLTNDIECLDGTFDAHGYQWSWTAGVDPSSPGTFVLDSSYSVGDMPMSVCAADLNGDGYLDLATANYDSDDVSVLLNDGNGVFAASVSYAVGDEPVSVFAADLDRDGDLDLATANFSSNDASVLLNDGNGTFATATSFDAGLGPGAISAADFDGDGDLDLAVANFYGNEVSILIGHGDGTYAAAKSYGAGSSAVAIFSADFDGDGDNDLVTANFTVDEVWLLLNNGDGSFATAIPHPVGDGLYSVIAADFEWDGDLDLAAINSSSDDISVLLNDGNGGFAPAVAYGVGDSPRSLFAADFDGDGDLDLVSANLIGADVSVLLNEGNGSFGSATPYSTGYGNRSVFAADFDGDADLDLVTTNDSYDYISILLNQTLGCCDLRGDFDNDGHVDPADWSGSLDYVFAEFPEEPGCYDEADARPDGVVNIADTKVLAYRVFYGVPIPSCDSTIPVGGAGSYPNIWVHLNGGDDVAYAGQVNTLEFYLLNTHILSALSLGLEISVEPTHTLALNPVVMEVGDAIDAFGGSGMLSRVASGQVTTVDSILFGNFAIPVPGLPPHLEYAHCYTMEFDLSDGPDLANGLGIMPIFYPPGGTWTAMDSNGTIPPAFNGFGTDSETEPFDYTALFDIVQPITCCVIRGDIDRDGALEPNIADLVFMVTYMFQAGPPPPCDEPYSPDCAEHYFAEADIDGDGSCTPNIADRIWVFNK